MELKKVIRDGKVAVLVSYGYGAGWYTWNTRYPQCLFSPEIVELVESDRIDGITDEYCEKLFEADEFCSLGRDGLAIEWLPVGTQFVIEGYDGSESLTMAQDLILTA